MKLPQPELIQLITDCAAHDTDTYLSLRALPRAGELEDFARALQTPVLVLLPGAVFAFPPEQHTVIAYGGTLPEEAPCGAVFADVRAAGAEDFSVFLIKHRIREWAVPFYECASPAEYGYRQSCGLPAELRASLPFRVHITAITHGDRTRQECLAAMGSVKYAFFGEPFADDITCEKAENERSALRLTAEQCAKHPWKRVAVLCTTRAKAEALYARVRGYGTNAALLHGGLTPVQAQAAVNAFAGGRTNVLIATKAALPSYPFITADRVYYFGLPYSLSHAARCASLAADGHLICVYCEDDKKLNRTLTAELFKTTGADAGFLPLREQMQRELLNAVGDL